MTTFDRGKVKRSTKWIIIEQVQNYGTAVRHYVERRSVPEINSACDDDTIDIGGGYKHLGGEGTVRSSTFAGCKGGTIRDPKASHPDDPAFEVSAHWYQTCHCREHEEDPFKDGGCRETSQFLLGQMVSVKNERHCGLRDGQAGLLMMQCASDRIHASQGTPAGYPMTKLLTPRLPQYTRSQCLTLVCAPNVSGSV